MGQPAIINSCPVPVYPDDVELDGMTQIPADNPFWRYNDRVVKQQEVLQEFVNQSKVKEK